MSIQDDIQKSIADNELYAIGETVFVDWKQAFDSYMQFEKTGSAKAQFNLGYMYARGDLMERDLAKAFEWYSKAAEKGDPRAHHNLSLMYKRGEGVLPDNVKSKEHLAQAIELGDVRAKTGAVLANSREALKQGDYEKAKSLFASISANNKEAEMGLVASSVGFKSVYKTHVKYSYHSSGNGNNKKFWKMGESVETEVDLTMTNHANQNIRVLVKALIRAGDGFVNISTIGGVLKAGEMLSHIIDPEDFGTSKICGVTIYSDREGSINKPVYSFDFPDISIQPDEAETLALPNKILQAQNEMTQNNKTAKPGGCFVLTVCYGSYDAPTVLAFRQFRDNHLARHKLGRSFISWYYKHAPQWADAIANKPRIKAIFRAVFEQLAKALPQ